MLSAYLQTFEAALFLEEEKMSFPLNVPLITRAYFDVVFKVDFLLITKNTVGSK